MCSLLRTTRQCVHYYGQLDNVFNITDN